MLIKRSFEMTEFESGVSDANDDIENGWFPTTKVTAEWVAEKFKVESGSSDEYIAGYLSVAFPKK
jgi:hypothetical protein